MEPVIEYLFGSGDGMTTRWTSPADADLNGDGTPDAVSLDFDGDGRRDDAMWDFDGDGVADVSALDLDDNGVCESIFRDSGRGVWDRPVDRADLERAPADPVPPPPGPSTELDTDGDGRIDAKLESSGRGGRVCPDRLYVDIDGDGQYDQALIDEDGDGRADTCYDSRDPRFGR